MDDETLKEIREQTINTHNESLARDLADHIETWWYGDDMPGTAASFLAYPIETNSTQSDRMKELKALRKKREQIFKLISENSGTAIYEVMKTIRRNNDVTPLIRVD